MTAFASICCMLAVLPEYPEFTDSITFQLNGLMVVFMALGGIWGLLEFTGMIFRRIDARRAAALPAPTSAGPDSLGEAPITPAIYAVIASAVYAEFHGRARIVTIESVEHDTSWAREGRRAIFYSHRVH